MQLKEESVRTSHPKTRSTQYTYVHMYTYTYAFVTACVHVRIHKTMYVCMYINRVCISAYTHSASIYALYVRMYVYIYTVCIYIYSIRHVGIMKIVLLQIMKEVFSRMQQALTHPSGRHGLWCGIDNELKLTVLIWQHLSQFEINKNTLFHPKGTVHKVDVHIYICIYTYIRSTQHYCMCTYSTQCYCMCTVHNTAVCVHTVHNAAVCVQYKTLLYTYVQYTMLLYICMCTAVEVPGIRMCNLCTQVSLSQRHPVCV